MVRKKFFSSSAGPKVAKSPEIQMVYKSAAESSILSGASSSRRQYERVGTSPGHSEPSGQKAQKTLKLGGNIAGRVCRNRVVRLHCLLRAPCNLVHRMKEHYSNLKEQARTTNFKVSDLFAGNQLLMHVNAAPVRGRRKSLKPSEGFVSRVRAPVGQREMRER
ncbi:hypothetical protein MPTK1_8g17300 [Marchantia polymorpha subsp. ruderalis]|uniref:Uncharacterized protein n=1 Tax=Marchantia polymorpha TaxID=3197 RepID=A0A2R6X8A6_MARPO|nr:hypothetical protein MARPO_0030s0064 [Marchantia polymorpha]BBN20201.1 hypothetical protein Mp_8g17300 [Marchantia polymorpha subsp. ruderalis]|eukprot:PTQ42319.1 hypothetical protein MARPO_0030s0064 [Marchantia polymorpha]